MTTTTLTRKTAVEPRTIETPIGTLALEGTDDALTRVLLPGSFAAGAGAPADDRSAGAPSAVAAAAHQLAEYFAGQRTEFDLPLSLQGTPFQRDVWGALAEIPYGHTIAYAELAEMVGRPRAYRAVGQANGANPIPIILPCHRVLASGGGLGGYGGGLETKHALLALEGVLAC